MGRLRARILATLSAACLGLSTFGDQVSWAQSPETPISRICGPAAPTAFEPIGNQESCYFVGPVVGTWTAGQAFCAGMGGHLATIGSAEENDLVSELIDRCDNGHGCWIGASDASSEGTFFWPDGTAVGYTPWGSGQPDDYCSGEDYVHLQRDGTWNDQAVDGGCSAWGLMNPICEVRRSIRDVEAPNPVALRFVRREADSYVAIAALTYADAFFIEAEFATSSDQAEQMAAVEWDGGSRSVTVFRTVNNPLVYRSGKITLRRPGEDPNVQP